MLDWVDKDPWTKVQVPYNGSDDWDFAINRCYQLFDSMNWVYSGSGLFLFKYKKDAILFALRSS